MPTISHHTSGTLGEDVMPIDTEVKKAFRQMWVGGALGVYFTAVARNLLTDVFGQPGGSTSRIGSM